MIAVVASGYENNGAGGAQAWLPRPSGVLDGDLVLVAIMLTSAGVTATPPDDSWTQVTQTDPSFSMGLSVWQHTALNDGPHWVFTLSSSGQAASGCIVLRGTDPNEPIDASAYAVTTSSSSTPTTPAITAGLPAEALITFAACDATRTFTAYNNDPTQQFQVVVPNLTLAGLAAVGPNGAAAGTTTLSGVANAAIVRIEVAPSYGLLSFDDSYDLLFRAMPPKVDQILDFRRQAGDYWYYFWVMAAVVKVYGHDLVDLVRREVVPYLSRYVLPRWEQIFGLNTRREASLTLPTRQQNVRGAWRAGAGQDASIPTVQAVLAPLLGYSPPHVPTVVEASRSALTTAHSYSAIPITIVSSLGTVSGVVRADEGGTLSLPGPQVVLSLTGTGSLSVVATLTAPGGATQSWTTTGSGAIDVVLDATAFVGHALSPGPWTLTLVNDSASSITVITASVVLEGIGPNQETAGAIFDWGVLVNWAQLGENGTPADFAAARLAIQRLAFAHTVGNLLQSSAPYPDTDTGAHAAIPDECIPT